MSAQGYEGEFLLHKDLFGGVTINSQENYDFFPPERFSQALPKILEHWKKIEIRGIWFKILLEHSQWVPICAQNGFEFHHAKKDYVMMTKWLDTGYNTIPLYPFTSIGVGGVVITTKGEVLLMKEQRGPYLGWKFPGGLADPDEELFEAVEREVLEETGVHCIAESIVCFRHQHKFRWHTDDFFFLLLLRPKNGDVAEKNIPKPCPIEAAECRWMTRSEINELPPEQFRPFHRMVLEKCDDVMKSKSIKASPFTDVNNRKYYMYFIE